MARLNADEVAKLHMETDNDDHDYYIDLGLLKPLSHLDVLASVCRRMKNCSKTLAHVEYVMGKFCIR